MPAVYQMYIKNRNGEMTSGRWFMKENEAINYASGFKFSHRDLLVIVCRETFSLESDPKPYLIEEIWRK